MRYCESMHRDYQSLLHLHFDEDVWESRHGEAGLRGDTSVFLFF